MDYPSDAKNFLVEIASAHPSFDTADLRYVAVRRGNRFVVLHAQVRLEIFADRLADRHLQTKNIRAGRCSLSSLGVTPESIFERLSDGLLVNDFVLYFDSDQGLRVNFQPLHPGGQNRVRLSVLSFEGRLLSEYLNQPSLDWELLAHDTPYVHLTDLLDDFGVGAFRGERTLLEIVAYQVAFIGASSKFEDGQASVEIRLAKSLHTDKAKVGMRAITNKQVTLRRAVRGSEMTWREVGDIRAGTFTATLPAEALLHCIAIYDDVAQHNVWLIDPSRTQNTRRSALQQFDPDLTTLREFLSGTSKVSQRQQDFELGCAWLLWLYGFSVCSVGLPKPTSQAPDIVAATSEGHFLVVECTLGLLRQDTKLARLHQRTVELRKALSESAPNLRVLPLIITALDRASVLSDVDAAAALGIVVLSQENLNSALEESILPQDSQTEFDKLEKSLTDSDDDNKSVG